MNSPQEMKLYQRIEPDDFDLFHHADMDIYIKKGLVQVGTIMFKIAFIGTFEIRLSEK